MKNKLNERYKALELLESLDENQAILYCKDMASWNWTKRRYAMVEFWKEVIFHIQIIIPTRDLIKALK